MLFNEIVISGRPLEQLVRLALSTKGVTVTSGTVDRYTSLLEAAILADNGESLDGNVWQGFIDGMDGGKLEGVIAAVGQSLGASSSEIAQFMSVVDATANVMGGADLDETEAALAAEFEAITPTEPEPYSHLDDDSRTVVMEVDRVMGAPDPARPEPQHREEEEAYDN